jgi:hypothetical protein
MNANGFTNPATVNHADCTCGTVVTKRLAEDAARRNLDESS